ncbi:FAD-binding protein [Nocardioides sp. JQ2195]|uniref:FAD-binding protein n=1 Tax=Nocardioides sp. JQ2195 TaxID=2592334 RepID=UPI00143E63E3|nr:FAD-binding protein [Nocardioides sp. JQ2195]QIX26502.1 FAD-binding protein [Nocardioides sp. JQ2195]
MTTAQTQQTWDDECDVLVVGSGGGALAGAYTAAREDLSVILVEASDSFGGTTAYSGGGMWFPNNAALRRDGSTDTPEDARTYYRAVVGDRTPVELQDAYLATGPALVDYLETDDDFEFMVWPWPDYFGSAPKSSATGRHIMMKPLQAEVLGSLRDSLRPTLPVERAGEPLPDMIIGGQALVGRYLLALSRKDNADLRLNTCCDELVRQGDTVVGAVVTQDGVRRRIRARRGVLIAAGGFEQNEEMRQKYGVPGTSRDAMGPNTNQGKAIQAGIDVGADVDLMSEAWWSPGLTHPDGSSTFSLWFTGGIFVDDNGERFVDESWAYDRLGRVVIDRMVDGTVTLPFWMIYDDRDGERPPVRSTSVPMGETADYQDAGLWVSADTIEELAAKIGVPADRLSSTVARFNTFAESGVDEDFHRGDEAYDRAFSEGGSPLVPIEKGPFRAAAFGISDLGTKGGLRTDASARVLDAEGKVIKGLYAAGNSMAAVSGTVYPGGGNPIGSCMVFSHLAALDMAGSAGPAA